MRRPAILLSLLASLSLVLTPFGMLHAHIDSSHEHVLVHGGHSHDFDLHDDHHADEHDGDELSIGHGDVAHAGFDQPSIAHTVQLGSDISDQVTQHPIKFDKFIADPSIRPPDIPDSLTSIPRSSSSNLGSIAYRAYLQPPLRGPPAAIPQAV